MTNYWTTVSIPRPLAEDIRKFVDAVGYWPSVGAFIREACITKMEMERERLRANAE